VTAIEGERRSPGERGFKAGLLGANSPLISSLSTTESAALTNFQTKIDWNQGFIIADRKERRKKKLRGNKNIIRESEMS